MHGDMVRFIALDLILRLVFAGVMGVPLRLNDLRAAAPRVARQGEAWWER